MKTCNVIKYTLFILHFGVTAGALPVAAPSPRTPPTSRTRDTLRDTLTPPPVSTHSRFLCYPLYLTFAEFEVSQS